MAAPDLFERPLLGPEHRPIDAWDRRARGVLLALALVIVAAGVWLLLRSDGGDVRIPATVGGSALAFLLFVVPLAILVARLTAAMRAHGHAVVIRGVPEKMPGGGLSARRYRIGEAIVRCGRGSLHVDTGRPTEWVFVPSPRNWLMPRFDGLLVSVDGRPTRRLVPMAIERLPPSWGLRHLACARCAATLDAAGTCPYCGWRGA